MYFLLSTSNKSDGIQIVYVFQYSDSLRESILIPEQKSSLSYLAGILMHIGYVTSGFEWLYSAMLEHLQSNMKYFVNRRVKVA